MFLEQNNHLLATLFAGINTAARGNIISSQDLSVEAGVSLVRLIAPGDLQVV